MFDRVKETTTTTGTGPYTLAGVVGGAFQSFAVVGDGKTVTYCCENGTDWETGIGTYTASGTTLARSVLKSSNGNAAVNWGAGTKTIFVNSPADWSPGPLIDVRIYGAISLDAITHATRNRAAIQSAINDASIAGGGIVLIPPGTWAIDGTAITLKSHVVVKLVGGSILKRYATATTLFDSPTDYPLVQSGVVGPGHINPQSGWDFLFDLHSPQLCEFGGFTVGNAKTTTCVMRIRPDASNVDPDANSKNAVGNLVRNVEVWGQIGVGLWLEGVQSGNVVTLNTFRDLNFSRVTGSGANDASKGKGIRLVKWVDNNAFEGVIRVLCKTGWVQGVVHNDDTDPTVDVGVYANHFGLLAVDMFDEGSGAANDNRIAIVLNKTKRNRVRELHVDPIYGTGSVALQDNLSMSHHIVRVAPAGGYAMEVYAKGVLDGYETNAPTHTQTHGSTSTGTVYYNTTDQTGNYERFSQYWSSNAYYLITENAGSGTARTLTIGTVGSAAISFVTASTARWQITSGGHLIGATDNAYDIGATGSNRPRSLFVGTNVTLGGVLVTGSGPTTLTDSAGKILSASLNTVAAAQGGTGITSLGTGVSTALGNAVDGSGGLTSKSYVDSSVTGLLDFKGSTDCSANPDYPAASKGDTYYVSVAGKIGGASGKSVEVGDVYVSSADNAGGTEASVGTSWFVMEHNLVGAVISGGDLGTPSSGTLTNCTGLPVSTGVSGLGTGIATFLATPSSANLLATVTDETGTGALVFASTPTLVTPDIGAATGTSLVASGGLTGATVTATSTAPSFVLTDTTASAKSLTVAVDANVAQLRESAGASGSLLSLDLTNNRAGLLTAAPTHTITLGSTGTGQVIYNTADQTTNYERLRLNYSAGNGRFELISELGGSGSVRDLGIGVFPAANLRFITSSSTRWLINSSGHFLTSGDNALDIGASGATRPRTGYFGTSVVTPLVTVLGSNGQSSDFKMLSELTTIAAAATTDTAIQIPAGAIVLAVSVRVTTVIPTAATFTVIGATSSTAFNTAAVSTASTTTNKGTAAGAYYNATAQSIRITPDLTPAANTGRVRVTIHYVDIVPPTS